MYTKPSIFDSIKTIIGVILSVVIVVFSLLAVMATTNLSVLGFTLLIPDADPTVALQADSLVFMKDINPYSLPPRGELVTFSNDSTEVLARVIDFEIIDNETFFFVTGGDFVEHRISVDLLVKQGSFLMPSVGSFVNFLITPAGLLVCIGLPLIIILILLIVHFKKLHSPNGDHTFADVETESYFQDASNTGKQNKGKKAKLGYIDPYEEGFAQNIATPQEQPQPQPQQWGQQAPQEQPQSQGWNQPAPQEQPQPQSQGWNQPAPQEQPQPQEWNQPAPQEQPQSQEWSQPAPQEQPQPQSQEWGQPATEYEQPKPWEQDPLNERSMQTPISTTTPNQSQSRPTIESILQDVTGHTYNFDNEFDFIDDDELESEFERKQQEGTMPLSYTKPETVDTDDDSTSLIKTREFFIAELQPEEVSKAHQYSRGAGFQANLNDFEKNNFNIDGIDVNVDSNNIQLAITENTDSDIYITVTEEFTNVVVNKEDLETSFALFKDTEDEKNKVIIRKKANKPNVPLNPEKQD